MPSEFGRLLTVADVALVLSIHPGEVAELIESGELPAIRIRDGVWRIERSVLRSFIDGKYEEERRAQLWAQAELADIPDISNRQHTPGWELHRHHQES